MDLRISFNMIKVNLIVLLLTKLIIGYQYPPTLFKHLSIYIYIYIYIIDKYRVWNHILYE